MKKNKKQQIKSRYRIPFLVFAVAPPVLMFLVFYVYTNFSSILMAFTDRHGVISLENFARFFREFQIPTSEIRIAFKNTFLTFVILLLAYPFKVLVSYFIYKKVPFAGFYRIVFFLPSIIFSVAINMIFLRMIGPEGIIAHGVRNWMGLDYSPELLSDGRFANVVILLQMLWLGFPGDLILWGGTFARIPEEVLEAGYIDGTTWRSEFTRIIAPMVWPTVSLQMILMFCGIFSTTGNVFLLTKGQYGTMTLSAWLQIFMLQNSGAKYSSNAYNYMSAIGLILTVVAITIGLCVRRITNKMFQDVEY